MKKHSIIKAFTAFTLALSLTLTASAFSGTGSGTSENPYQVTSCSELDEVRDEKTANYQLQNNINCEGNTFTSINDFSGTFNGSGYEIQNFRIIEPSQDAVGVFGHVTGGTVVRTGIRNAEVEGSQYVGALIGELSNGLLSESYAANSTVTGDDEVGGLIGLMRGGDPLMTRSYAINTTASGPSDVGGLIGQINNGEVTKSYSTSSADMNSGQNTDGVLLGKLYGGSVSNSYYLETEEPGNSDGGSPKSKEELQQKSTYTGWDFDDSWDRCETGESNYPVLQESETSCLEPPEITAPAPDQVNKNPESVTLSAFFDHPTDSEINISFYDGDDNQIASLTERDAGQVVSADWNGLESEESYHWYASASVNGETVETDTQDFTTITAEVNWKDESVNEKGYRVFENSTGSFLETARTNPNTESTTIASPGLAFGKYTCFRIRSFNNAGQSEPAESCITP